MLLRLLLVQLLLLLRLVDHGCRRARFPAPLLLLVQRDVVRTDQGRVELVARDGRDAVRGGPGRRLRWARPVHHRAGIRAAAVAAADELLLVRLLAERLPPVADAARFGLVLGQRDAAVGYQQDILWLLVVMLLLELLKVLLRRLWLER